MFILNVLIMLTYMFRTSFTLILRDSNITTLDLEIEYLLFNIYVIFLGTLYSPAHRDVNSDTYKNMDARYFILNEVLLDEQTEDTDEREERGENQADGRGHKEKETQQELEYTVDNNHIKIGKNNQLQLDFDDQDEWL